jgi:hypothetical protein
MQNIEKKKQKNIVVIAVYEAKKTKKQPQQRTVF